MSKSHRNDGGHEHATPVQQAPARTANPTAGLSNAEVSDAVPDQEHQESWFDRLADFFTGGHQDQGHAGHGHGHGHGHDPVFGVMGPQRRVNEENARTAVEYELRGPEESESHAFRGATVPAYTYTIVFADGPSFPIVAPRNPDERMSHHTVEEAADAAALIPLSSRLQITRIVLNPVENPDDDYWAAEYEEEDFESYMTAGAAGVITIYPSDSRTRNATNLQRDMLHETGHIWSKRTWGQNTEVGGWNRWRQVMGYDGQSLSTYADESIGEDVAETIQAYASTIGTPRHAELRRQFPNRFALLDREYASEAMLAELGIGEAATEQTTTTT